MTGIKAVKEAAPHPRAGKPKAQSDVQFPYYDLDSSIAVAKVIHDGAGGVCDRATLAGLLKYSSQTNGSFLTRVAAARMFGLIEPADSGQLRLSDRGRAIVAPVFPGDADRAKVEAFLGVELFRRVFEHLNGGQMPEAVGMRRLIESQYGVVKARVAPTVRIMTDSARQAGFFAVAADKMIRPRIASGQSASPLPSEKPPERLPENLRHGGGGGGGNGSGGHDDSIHPAFRGLLSGLPEAGARLSAKRRKALTDAFSNIVNVVYPEDDDIGA